MAAGILYAILTRHRMSTSDPFGRSLPALATARLRLRHPRPADVERVLAVFSDPQAMRYWSSEPFADLAAARAYLGSMEEGFESRTLFQWAVTLPADDQLIGTVTLAGWDRPNRRAELGYMLAREHWGVGLASEAVRAVLGFGFAEMGLHRVEAELDPRNEPSARLLRRFGFRYEGLLRERWYLYDEWSDSALYGLLRSDFDAGVRGHKERAAGPPPR